MRDVYLVLALEPIGSVLMAMGRVNPLLKATAIAAAVELSLLYPALRFYGLEGVACVVTVAYIAQYVIYFPVLKRDIGLNFRDFVLSFKPALISALVVAVVIFALEPYMPDNLMIRFGVKLSSSSFMYILAYGILSKWKLARELHGLILNMRPIES